MTKTLWRSWWTLALSGLILAAACRAADGKSYTLDGDASAVSREGTALLWRYGTGLDSEEIARVPLEDGKFRFSGQVDAIGAAGIVILALGTIETTLAKVDLILEPGVTRVTLFNYPAPAEVRGGPYFRKVFASWQKDPRYAASSKQAASIQARIDGKMPEAGSSTLSKEALRHEHEALRVESAILGRIHTNDPDPLVRFLALQQKQMADWMRDKQEDAATRIAALEAIQKQLPGNFNVPRAIARIREFQKREMAAAAIKVGSVIHDFSAPGIDGREVRLSDVLKRQKYVLVEFWASWCGPCRAEIPALKRAYSSFHAKGFEIVSFSLDKQREAWRKASDEEHLPWVNTSDLKDRDSPVARTFGVTGVPANYLVDRKGTVVARDLRGKELEKKLAELM